MSKFLVWHALVVVVSCELFSPEVGYNIEYAPKYDNYKPRDYHFSYAVSDPHTGDHKSQWEVKIDGVVRGGYSLLEPDGTTRVVEYVADDHGFRAVVNKIGVAVHPTPIQPAVVPLPEVNHFKAYSGEVANYANVGVQPILYRLEQSLGDGAIAGTVETGGSIEVPSGTLEGNVGVVISRPQALGTVEGGGEIKVPSSTIEGGIHGVDLERVIVPQQVQQQVPLAYGRIEAIPSQEYSLGRIGTVEGLRLTHTPLQVAQAVPPYQIHNFGGVEGGVGKIEAPLQQQSYQIHSLGGIGQNLGQEGRIEVPRLQVQGGIGKIEAPLQQQYYQIHSLGGIGQNLGQGGRIEAPLQQERVEVVPTYQGHISGRVEGLGQVQGSVDGGYRIDTNYGPVQGPISTNVDVGEQGISNKIDVVPQRLEPIGPSYQTSIVYGLTGNPEDDSQYTKDEYTGSSSQKVSNMVPAPSRRHSVVKQPLKEQFLIYLPDSSSKN